MNITKIDFVLSINNYFFQNYSDYLNNFSGFRNNYNYNNKIIYCKTNHMIEQLRSSIQRKSNVVNLLTLFKKSK